MKEIICYTTYLPEGTEQYISFLELLLNENLADGKIECPEEVYAEIGDINHKLTAKQNYEFLLRAVRKYPFKVIGVSHESIPSGFLPSIYNDLWNSYCTDCYIVCKYQQELLSIGYFDIVMESLTQNVLQLPDSKKAVDFLEKMLSHAPEYYTIDDDTQPILLYRGPNICYNALSLFIHELAKALRSCRQRVQIIDGESGGFSDLTPFIGCHFKAMIGIQTSVFSNMFINTNTNLSNLIVCPKFNILLDHPIVMKEQLENGPKNYYLLLHDRNYISFAKHYHSNIKKCLYFPPAGTLPQTPYCSLEQKKYDITFIGTFFDYRKLLSSIWNYGRFYRHLAARYIYALRHNPDCPAETAFWQALEYYGISLSNADFLSLFDMLKPVPRCISYYFREKIIHTLLNADIEIHVYGNSWKNAPFANHKSLICHTALPLQDTLYVMQRSKISLNIMSWHKDGLTERILNGMLCQSAVLSDTSTRLEEEFIDGEDIILFRLTQISSLPNRIRKLLAAPEQLQKIAENGYKKAMKKHLWIHRAKQLLNIIDTQTAT